MPNDLIDYDALIVLVTGSRFDDVRGPHTEGRQRHQRRHERDQAELRQPQKSGEAQQRAAGPRCPPRKAHAKARRDQQRDPPHLPGCTPPAPCRIEQGVPSHGSELTDAYNPLEAGLLKHISFNKGCYIGQEVVTRLDTYDKVQKHLVGISWNDHDVPAANATLSHDGKKVGTLTSAVVSPRLDHGIGLAYVRKGRSQAVIELTLTLPDGETAARVEPLPFE